MSSISPEQALRMIKDKEGEFGKLYARMKVDAALTKRTKFVLSDDQGKAIPNCNSVTLPRAAKFINRANAIMSAANQQINVEGEGIKDPVTSKIETFFKDSLKIADELLSYRNMPPLFAFQTFHANVRGRMAQRVLVEINDDGTLKVDIIPWDTLYATYDFDIDGVAWAAYTTPRTKTMIESEYKVVVGTKTGKITSFWDRDQEHIFLNGKHILTNPNPFGEVPVAIALSPAGLLFLDEDVEENRGESILWLARDLFEEANRVASIVQTLNTGALFPPQQKEYEEIPTEKPPYPMAGTRSVAAVKKGELYHPMPRADVYQATQMIWSIIDSEIQQNSFSTIEYGSLQFPLSSVALESLAEGRELVLLPGLQALSILYLQTCRMIAKQFIALNQSVMVRGQGQKATYAPKNIEGDYNISFSYFTGSRKYALAGVSEVQVLKPLNIVSDDYLRRETLKLDDPDGDDEQRHAEQLEKTNPAIQMYRQLKGLVDKDDSWAEAWMVRKQLMDIVRAQFAPPAIEQPKAQPKGSIIPLFTGAPSKVGGRQPGGINAAEQERIAETTENITTGGGVQ